MVSYCLQLNFSSLCKFGDLFAINWWTVISKLNIWIPICVIYVGKCWNYFVFNSRRGKLCMWKSRCYCRRCPTVMCLDDGIGPKISTVAFSQHFSGNLYGLSDSLVLLLVNASHASHFSIKFLTFCPYHESRNYFSILLICSDQDVTTIQATKFGANIRGITPIIFLPFK